MHAGHDLYGDNDNDHPDDNLSTSVEFVPGVEVLYLLDRPEAACQRIVQRTDDHYDYKLAREGDERCMDSTLILINRNVTQAVPGYALIFEDGVYGLWEKRR